MRHNRKQQMIDYNNSVVKSNEFSMAKLNEGLTLNQTQLLVYTIFCTQQANNVAQFKRTDFEEKFGLIRYQSTQAKKDAQKLLKLNFSTEDIENDTFSYQNVFQKISYEKGIFSFQWTDDMLPHIIDLKEKYIVNDLTITANFKSSFSWKLYDYIKANYGNWYKKVSKRGLMRLFGVEHKKSYNNTSVFKKGVLDVAIAEINQYTEYTVHYEDQYSGRAITGFVLKWSVGQIIQRATKAQRETILMYVQTIEDDAMSYFMSLAHQKDLLRMQKIIKEITSYKLYCDASIDMTHEEAARALIHMKQLFQELQTLIRTEKRDDFLYNWLKYDSKEEQEAFEARQEARELRQKAAQARKEATYASETMQHIAYAKATALEEMADQMEAYAEEKMQEAVVVAGRTYA